MNRAISRHVKAYGEAMRTAERENDYEELKRLLERLVEMAEIEREKVMKLMDGESVLLKDIASMKSERKAFGTWGGE